VLVDKQNKATHQKPMLTELFEGNMAWALERHRADPTFFKRLSNQQKPKYLWIGCSDSRVPANEIVGLDPGEIFVHRNVANVVHEGDFNVLSVLEFAVHNLGVEHILVCGHYGCGGVRAVIQGERGGLVGHWISPIAEIYRRNRYNLEAIEDPEARINALCELNVEMQVKRVAATPILADAWNAGKKIAVHGIIYGLKDGLLRDLNITIHSLEELDDLSRLKMNAEENLIEPVV
jgi:carbonic anhydrase